MFILQVRNEILEDQRLPLPSDAVIIGRGDDADLKISDQSVSRFHARLEVAAEHQLLVTDLGSSNGTFLNDVRLAQPTFASAGDTIRFGSVTCTLIYEPSVAGVPSDTDRVKSRRARARLITAVTLLVALSLAFVTWQVMSKEESKGTPELEGSLTDTSEEILPPTPTVLPDPVEGNQEAPTLPTNAPPPPDPSPPKENLPTLDVIELKDGTVLRGHVEDLEHPIAIPLRLPSGSVRAIPRESIRRINGIEQSLDLQASYRARLAAAGSLEDLLALARWCQTEGLSQERREVAQMIVEGDRENEVGNAILGRYRYQGEWLTLEAIREMGALDANDRLVGTDAHRRSLSRAFLLLLSRPPLEVEFYGALKLPLDTVLNEVLASEDHWRTFVEDILDRFLHDGAARALPGAFDALISDLSKGDKTFADAFQVIAASPGVAVLYASPREFAQKVLEVFLGPGAAADEERLTAATEMIGGERTAVFGERGSSKKDFLSIVSRQPAFFRRQLRVETERILGETLERKDLTRSAMTLAANPASFQEIRKSWVQEALSEPTTLRRKSSRQFARSLWVELTQSLPSPDSAFLTEALHSLNTPQDMRRLLPMLLAPLGTLVVPDQGELSDAAYTADAFRRVLRRSPTREELEAGLLTLRDEGMKAVLRDLLSSSEFQLF